MVSTVSAVDGRVVNRDGDGEKGRLSLLGNRISVDIFYAFLHYRSLSEEDDIVEMCILQFTRFDARVATLLTCSEQRKKRGGHE